MQYLKTLRCIRKGGKTGMNKLTYNVKELPEVLGIGIAKAYQMLKNREIPHIRCGKRIIVSKKSLEDFLRERSSASLVK